MTSDFLAMEASAGILLVIAAVIALIIANTPLYGIYDHILHGIYFRIGFDDLGGSFDHEIKKSLLHWINDGFMAIFFFLVGLEIKREVVTGELSSRARALLPAIAAIGGMAIPALFYYVVNIDTPENMAGWAIPAATDIAFALGVLALLGSRVPISLKILLTAIAIIDDLGAILIIAFFYTDNLAMEPLMFAAAALVGLFILNRTNIAFHKAPYIILGIILWVAVLKSGVHATLAGVATAFFIPVRDDDDPSVMPCKELEHTLHPWVAFGILPIFAFTNAGVPFKGMGFDSLFDPTTLGIILGLFLGKQLGIFSALFLAIKTGLSPKPEGATWLQLYGVSVLCGIGFTMSLFIGGLAFADIEHQASIRLGVLVGSVASAVVGYLILRASKPAKA
ncbi:MAG: Na+/H+ antiporter NhaA [Micavibrio sp.]|nr:Na+/H+ antiporter NhaA [Micavibrio sp.]